MKKLLSLLLIFMLSTSVVFAAEEVGESSEETQETIFESEETIEEKTIEEDKAINEDIAIKEELEPEKTIKAETEYSLKVTAELQNNTSATLSWTVSPTIDTTYSVEKSSKNGKETFSTSSNSMTFDNLDVNETYTFKVSFSDENGKKISAETQITTSSLQAVQGLKAYSAYKGVMLEWLAVENAVSYEVYRDNKLVATVSALNYLDRLNGEGEGHSYRIVAVAKNGSKATSSQPVSKESVRPMYISIKFRSKSKLKSHDGKNVKHTFKKGQVVMAHGFGQGKYQFYYNGNLYYTRRIRVKNARANYTQAFNYSKEDAEAFVNSSGKSSNTPWLIWVSQYTQHCYVFYGRKGAWKLQADWEVATGKATTPSPTGFNKKIHRKIKSFHGLGPWSCYSSTNAFHGKKKKWKVGAPASNGCIRNPNEKAKWLYKTVPIRTSVIIH